MLPKPEQFLLDEESFDIDNRQSNNNVSPYCKVKVNGISAIALLDAGAHVSCISEKLFDLMPKEIMVLPVIGVSLKGAFNKLVKVTRQTYVTVSINEIQTEIVCLIVKSLSRDLILGVDWLYKNEVELNFSTKMIVFHKVVENNRIPMFDETTDIHGEQETTRVIQLDLVTLPQMLIDNEDKEQIEPDGITDHVNLLLLNSIVSEELHPTNQEIHQIVDENKLITTKEKVELTNLLEKHRQTFSTKPGLIKGYEHTIEIIKETHFTTKSYPVPFKHRDKVEEQLQIMLDWKIIERAVSSYVNPLVTIIKKDGSVRLCLDARQINAIMVPDKETPNNPDELLQKFVNMKWLSTIDMTSSFYQIALEEHSRKYTAFQYNQRIYQFKVLPFGLKTSIASFTRCIDLVLGPEIRAFTTVYVDDLLIASESYEQHLRHLDMVLNRLKEAGITTNMAKSKFCRDEVKFLGHVITPQGTKLDPQKVELIRNWPTPKNVRQLKSFLGLCSYCRKYSSSFAQYSVRLLTLLQQKTRWKWTNELERDFMKIKGLFVESLLLYHADYTKPFYMKIDACDYGLGAHIYQLGDNGEIEILSMASRTLKTAELHYTTTEKELLAIVWALMKFRTLVHGTDLTILTDHKAITFLMSSKLITGRLARWILVLQAFSFTIEHCSGIQNEVADALSRYPQQDNGELLVPVYADKELLVAEMLRTTINVNLRKKLKRLNLLQKEDTKLQNIMTKLEQVDGNNVKIEQHYRIYNNVLFFRSKSDSTDWRIVIPEVLVKDIIWDVHTQIGHFGPNKCIHMIKQSFHFVNLDRTVKDVLKTCDLCQRTKCTLAKLRGELHSILPINKGELVTTDIYGPLPKAQLGVQYVIVFLDNFTKYVKLYAMRNATAKSVIAKLNLYIANIQKPKCILADHGTQYISKAWTQLLKQNDIKPLYSSIRHPQSKSTERVMRELGRMFRAYCRNKHTTWNKVLPNIEEWLNITVHDSVGFTPIELQYGIKPQSRIHKLLDFPDMITPIDMNVVVTMARDRMQQRANKRKKLHDAKYANKINLKEGDTVLLKSLHLSSAIKKETKKFFDLYEGPYSVKTVVAPNAYLLVDTDNVQKGIHNIVNLKLYNVEQR